MLQIFSMPRIVPYVQMLRLKGFMSLDKLNGWDLLDDDKLVQAFGILMKHKPKVVMISPPCTAFSKLQVDGCFLEVDPI